MHFLTNTAAMAEKVKNQLSSTIVFTLKCIKVWQFLPFAEVVHLFWFTDFFRLLGSIKFLWHLDM